MPVPALRFDPCQNFGLAETPVFSQPVSRQTLLRSFAHPSVNPRDRHVEETRDFMNCEQLVLLSFCFHCGSVTAGFLAKIEPLAWRGNSRGRSARLRLTSPRIKRG